MITCGDTSIAGLPNGIPRALRLLLAAAAAGEVDPSTPSFRYDVVDLGRQMLCNVHSDLAILAGWEFEQFARAPIINGSSAGAAIATQEAVVELIRDLDTLLATHESFMLGPRMKEALAWVDNATRAHVLQYQFLNQVSIWGPTHALSVSSGHNDYAAKNWWAGLVGKYYAGRWELQSQAVAHAARSGTPAINTTNLSMAMRQLEEAFSQGSDTPFPLQPTGDTLAEAAAVLSKYAAGNATRHGYRVFKLTDAVPASQPVDMILAWNSDLGVLQVLCNADPHCAGFNTGGWLKNDTQHRVPSRAKHDLWVKVV